ncbi:hypothetical protein KCV07_g222, partial [Aureobasidium melanogenum]
LFKILLYLISGISCVKMAAASALKGVEEMPWNERLQSTCFSPSSRVGGGSLRPSVSERIGSLGARGAAVFGAVDGARCDERVRIMLRCEDLTADSRPVTTSRTSVVEDGQANMAWRGNQVEAVFVTETTMVLTVDNMVHLHYGCSNILLISSTVIALLLPALLELFHLSRVKQSFRRVFSTVVRVSLVFLPSETLSIAYQSSRQTSESSKSRTYQSSGSSSSTTALAVFCLGSLSAAILSISVEC